MAAKTLKLTLFVLVKRSRFKAFEEEKKILDLFPTLAELMYQAAPLQSHLLGSADRRVQVTSAEAAAPSVGETWKEKKPPQPAPHSSAPRARAQFAFSNKQLTGRKYGPAH